VLVEVAVDRHGAVVGGETGVPVDGVGAEEGDVHAGVAGRGRGVVHAGRPVLRVPADDQRLVPQQLGGAPVDVDVGRVVDVGAGAVHRRDGGDVVPEVGRGAAALVGGVEGGDAAGVGAFAAHVVAVVGAVAAVLVVRLVGQHRGLHQQWGGAGVVADDERDR